MYIDKIDTASAVIELIVISANTDIVTGNDETVINVITWEIFNTSGIKYMRKILNSGLVVSERSRMLTKSKHFQECIINQ